MKYAQNELVEIHRGVLSGTPDAPKSEEDWIAARVIEDNGGDELYVRPDLGGRPLRLVRRSRTRRSTLSTAEKLAALIDTYDLIDRAIEDSNGPDDVRGNLRIRLEDKAADLDMHVTDEQFAAAVDAAEDGVLEALQYAAMCQTCGGSGGGPDAVLYCTSCSGTGDRGGAWS